MLFCFIFTLLNRCTKLVRVSGFSQVNESNLKPRIRIASTRTQLKSSGFSNKPQKSEGLFLHTIIISAIVSHSSETVDLFYSCKHVVG